MLDIILDRDGVINHDSPDYIKSPDEWQPIEKSIEAIAMLKQANHRVFVATNQSGIGRGLYSEQLLEAMHLKMSGLLRSYGYEFDGIYYCPHLPSDQCSCRKPLPGLLRQIANNHQVQLTSAYFVGDALTDLKAAQAVQAKPVLVLTGKGSITQQKLKETTLKQVPIFNSLYDWSCSILANDDDMNKNKTWSKQE